MKFEGGCWPTPRQEALLAAALLEGEASLDAWRRFKMLGGDLDQLDPGSQRLLPLLYQKLRGQGVADAPLEKLKGAYRHSWYRNQLLFHHGATLLGHFRSAGIDTMILKGPSLAVQHYRDPGLRPMNDFDLLVPTSDALRAFELMERLGWRAAWQGDASLLVAMRHALSFKNSTDQSVDLHWHLFPEGHEPGADLPFWTGSMAAQFRGEPTRVLNPTDQLLHVCVHGAAWNPIPPLRWVADAATILRSAPQRIDWSRLTALARELGFVLPLADTLRYLVALLNAPIPPSVLEELQAVPVSRIDRWAYGAKIGHSRLLGGLPAVCFQYLERTRKAGLPARVAGFPLYLQFALGVVGWRQALVRLSLRGVQRAGESAAWYGGRWLKTVMRRGGV